MAVKKFLRHLVKGKPYNLSLLLEEIKQIRKTNSCLALCASPTGANWLGIRNATLQLFPNGTVQLPQHYSQQLLEDRDLQLLAGTIREQQFRNVVFSGFPAYFAKLVDLLQHAEGLQVSVILHGTFSEAGAGGKLSDALAIPLLLLQQKKIHKLAAVRKDVAEFIEKHWDCKAFSLHNKCIVAADIEPTFGVSNETYIGVFGTENFNKNLHNQVAGAVTVANGRVFVAQPQLYTYLNVTNITGVLRNNHHEFLRVLASMDINLHLSFSESWGQIAAESMALGVPCLVSPNTNLLDKEENLRHALTVYRVDSPLHITSKIESVLDRRAELSIACRRYMAALNDDADVLMQNFLEG